MAASGEPDVNSSLTGKDSVRDGSGEASSQTKRKGLFKKLKDTFSSEDSGDSRTNTSTSDASATPPSTHERKETHDTSSQALNQGFQELGDDQNTPSEENDAPFSQAKEEPLNTSQTKDPSSEDSSKRENDADTDDIPEPPKPLGADVMEEALSGRKKGSEGTMSAKNQSPDNLASTSGDSGEKEEDTSQSAADALNDEINSTKMTEEEIEIPGLDDEISAAKADDTAQERKERDKATDPESLVDVTLDKEHVYHASEEIEKEISKLDTQIEKVDEKVSNLLNRI